MRCGRETFVKIIFTSLMLGYRFTLLELESKNWTAVATKKPLAKW